MFIMLFVLTHRGYCYIKGQKQIFPYIEKRERERVKTTLALQILESNVKGKEKLKYKWYCATTTRVPSSRI